MSEREVLIHMKEGSKLGIKLGFDPKVELSYVLEFMATNSIAQRHGVRLNDYILAIGGAPVARPATTSAVVKKIREAFLAHETVPFLIFTPSVDVPVPPLAAAAVVEEEAEVEVEMEAEGGMDVTGEVPVALEEGEGTDLNVSMIERADGNALDVSCEEEVLVEDDAALDVTLVAQPQPQLETKAETLAAPPHAGSVPSHVALTTGGPTTARTKLNAHPYSSGECLLLRQNASLVSGSSSSSSRRLPAAYNPEPVLNSCPLALGTEEHRTLINNLRAQIQRNQYDNRAPRPPPANVATPEASLRPMPLYPIQSHQFATAEQSEKLLLEMLATTIA